VIRNLVLLPGLDGTGKLFSSFLASLPTTFVNTTVAYPADKFHSYEDLLRIVDAAVPKEDPFVLLGESFSTPIAVELAAANPPNLVGVVLVAGFVRSPIGAWSLGARLIANPWFFKMRLPDWTAQRALLGANAPVTLLQTLRQALESVNPAVLSGRVQEALNCDARSELARTNVPMMYVQAANDRLLSKGCFPEIKQIKPNIAFASIDGPHLLLQRAPEEAAQCVSSFVANLSEAQKAAS